MKLGTLHWRPNGTSGDGRWCLDLGPEDWWTNPETGKVEKWIECPNIRRNDEESKRKVRAWREEYRAARIRQGADVVKQATADESADDWFKRYYEAAEKGEAGKKNRGKPQVAIEGRRGRYKNHIAPFLSGLTMKQVTKEVLRSIVAYLDDQARKRDAFYRNGAKDSDLVNGRKPGRKRTTTTNVWGEVITAFREAYNSKNESLRLLDHDITDGVHGTRLGRRAQTSGVLPAGGSRPRILS